MTKIWLGAAIIGITASVAVGNVSEFVNSSAANAEECAVSSQELNGQAAKLKNMLDKFRA